MKTKIFGLLAFCLFFGMANADEKVISEKQLPAPAVKYLQTHFKGVSISRATQDTDLTDKDYEVYLSNGVKIEFNAKGDEAKNIESKNGTALPMSVISLKSIQNYLAKNYATAKVLEFEKDNSLMSLKYKLKLDNGLELEFDGKGNFLRIDD